MENHKRFINVVIADDLERPRTTTFVYQSLTTNSWTHAYVIGYKNWKIRLVIVNNNRTELLITKTLGSKFCLIGLRISFAIARRFNRFNCCIPTCTLNILLDIGHLFHCKLFHFFHYDIDWEFGSCRSRERTEKESELCHAMPASYACLLMQINGKRVTSVATVGRHPPPPTPSATQLFCSPYDRQLRAEEKPSFSPWGCCMPSNVAAVVFFCVRLVSILVSILYWNDVIYTINKKNMCSFRIIQPLTVTAD